MQLKTSPIILGKKGISKDFINHVNKELKRHKIVKIKVLKNSGISIDDAVKEIKKKTNTGLVKKIGRVFILRKS